MSTQPSRLESVLTRAWMRRGPLAWLLLPWSALFGLLAASRRALYHAGWLASVRLPVPVIVVGNIFIGGTGKTPFTIWLVDALRGAGFYPGVISRGYGGRLDAPLLVTTDADPGVVGDEPLLIAQRARCPVMVGRDRVAAARALLQQAPGIDLIVSDDGLQHYALQRDIEIVLFDERGAGNGWLLPAGPLREPATRRRDFTVINSSPPSPAQPTPVFRMQLTGAVVESLGDRLRQITLASLAEPKNGRVPTVLAAAGIGNPARFFSMLRAAGLNFQEMPLPDHYDFAANPFADVAAEIILITEKDAVKCARSDALKNDPRLWVVPVAARLDRLLLDQLLEKLRGCSPA